MTSTKKPEEIIEVDDSPLVTDGTSDYYTSKTNSSTQSVTSSVYHFQYDNGRRYTLWGGEGKYVQPNDETEQDRLDIMHHYQNVQLGGELHTAPLSNPQRILDCGTGTGIWALDMGDRYPSAEVIGVDLSPIQPSWVAPNVRFEIDDLEKEWTFKENYFDFIHSRHMAMGIHDWKAYIQQMFKHTAPGGWIELSEQEQALYCDDGTYAGSNLEKWMSIYLSLAPKVGLKFTNDKELVAFAKEAGFVDVSVTTWKQPQGPWAKDKKLKELGKIGTAITETAFDSHGLQLFTSVGGIGAEEAKRLGRLAHEDVVGRKVHAYNRLWHVIGRKPTEKEAEE